MKITKIEYFRLDLPLSEPYTIAYETVHSASNIILQITTDTGLTGWGCAAPDEEITGEKVEDVVDAIEGWISPLLIGESPFQIIRFQHQLSQTAGVGKSALAMVDTALYDLLARKAGIPLYQLLGGFRHAIETSITIGICPLEETIEKTRKYRKEGFRVIKLKGGLSVEGDIEKVAKLREVFGGDFRIRFDANQGFTPKQAIEFVQATTPFEVEILEQPTTVTQEADLKQVTDRVKIPVMADESIRSLHDAFHLNKNEIIDMVNIKIMKVGGITEAQHINSVAKAASCEVMVGCLDECALGIAAGLHFALSRPNIEFADLDGHLDLLNDPFEGLFSLKNGILRPTESSGLGTVRL